MLNFVGYTPPQNAIDAELLIKRGLIPKSLTSAVVRPDQFAANQELLQLSVEGERLLGRRLVEVQGRLTMESRWTWRLLALPGVVWLAIFFLVSFYAVLCVAFGNQDTLSQPVPFWNPLDWNVGYVLEVLRNIWHGGQYLTVFLRTLEFVAIAMGLSLLIGYPVAYFAARHSRPLEGARPARCWWCRSGSTT